MEKWMSKGRRSPLKADIDFPKNRNKNFERIKESVEKKKGKKWSFGNFLRRKSKETQTPNSISTQTIADDGDLTENIYAKIEIKEEVPKIKWETSKNSRITCSSSSESSLTSQDLNSPQNPEIYPKNGRKNRFKARIQAKREKFKGNSSSEDEIPSNLSLLRFHSADSIQNSPKNESYSSKKCRGARTERYMKRLYTNGENKPLTDQNSGKSQLKYSSDILPSIDRSPIDDSRYCTHRNHSLFGSDYNIPSYKPQINDNHVYSKIIRKPGAKVNLQPPEPPPRSFKLHINPKTMRYSLQNSDIENDQSNIFRNRQYNNNVNCNSLDRMYTCQVSKFNHHPKNSVLLQKNRSLSPSKTVSWSRELEKPIIPRLQERNVVISNNLKNSKTKFSNADDKYSSDHGRIRNSINSEMKCADQDDQDKKRHSKNLEEALEELETIYKSLRLNDEDLLDRAEERSMEEYRDKLANAVEGSIKSTSDSSSSNEMAREVFWRDLGMKNCCDDEARLKDDMAYRRMHQNERPSSVDNYGSISRMSYLTSSPCLSYKEMEYYEKICTKSRRDTPDLTRDDVAFRSICHANNTLKIMDPQPPFGIPIGPVSGAAESDYLHVEPNKEDNCRSLYIPNSEPDIVTDDLAFRSLRKDTSRDRSHSPGNMSFLPKTLFTTEMKKKRAVRSLSADLYGIINNDSKQSSWYKKYVKLNRPLRISGILEASDDINKCVDINGNKPKPKINNYRGKIQVNVPKVSGNGDDTINQRKSMDVEVNFDKVNSNEETLAIPRVKETRDKAISSFTDYELLEYRELCRELENLIKKTSERVKSANKIDSRRNSLTEFVKWEELLGNNNVVNEDGGKEEPLVSSYDDGDEHDKAAIKNHSSEDDKSTAEAIDDPSNQADSFDQSNSSNAQVPSASISELTSATTEPLFSSNDNLEDGSSYNETTNNPNNTFEKSPVNTYESSNDVILIASKDTESNIDYHDEINIASLNEGEIMDNEYNNVFSRHLLKSIMNVCFVTNCLTAYSVALWSLCLTLLIAIIVAL